MVKNGESVNPTAGEPFRVLDAFRGFAALSVVVLHAIGPVYDQVPEARQNPILRFGLNGGIGVPVFFVISGYCILHAAMASRTADGPLRTFVCRRLRRIFPPYWCALVLFFAQGALAQILSDSGVIGPSKTAEHHVLDAGSLYWLANVTLFNYMLHQRHLVSVGWTLSYEIAFYAIVAALLAATIRASARVMLVAVHAVTFACLAVLIARPDWAVYPFDFWPLFGVGAIVYHVTRADSSYRTRSGAVALTILCCVVAFQHPRWGIGDRGMVGLVTYGPAIACALAMVALRPFDRRISAALLTRTFGAVGIVSYGLYLTHILPMGVIHHVTRATGVMATYPMLAALLAALAGVAFGTVFSLLCERPFARRGKRRETTRLRAS